MNRKWLALLVAGLTAFTMVGCGSSSTAGTEGSTDTNEGTKQEVTQSGEKVEVTILGNIKAEIKPQFEELVENYNSSQDKYEVVSVPLDGNAFEKMTALYASGNAPTIMTMGQEVAEFKDNLLDLSGQPLLEHAQEGSYDLVSDGDKVFGFPLTVEAFGILYNQDALDAAVGGTFDASTINTRSSLEKLYEQVEATGKSAVHISPLDWSLGAHVTNLFFAPQSENVDEILKFIDDLKAGNVSLIDNTVFNGWLDTFDMLMNHNSSKASPLSPTYDEGALEVAEGEAATWFQGNWTLGMLQEVNPEVNMGIMPYPISDNPEDYGNTQISVGVPLYLSIDASQSTPEEQAGALDFINYFITSEVGQKIYVEDMKLIPVYDNVTAIPEDTLSQAILKYMQDGKTLNWINMYYPGDGSAAMGASMQKYLNGDIDRAQLASELEAYWQGK